MAVPGKYTVSLDKRVNGVLTTIAGPVEFEAVPLGEPTLPPADRAAVLAFARETGELQRAVFGANEAAKEAANRIKYIKSTIEKSAGLDPSLLTRARALELSLTDLQEALTGDRTQSNRSEPEMPGMTSRINSIVYGLWGTTSAPTTTHRRSYEIASGQFAGLVDRLRQLIETDLVALEKDLEAAGAPWTPGRGVPQWKGN